MDPMEKVVYSLRLHAQVKEALQDHFDSMGSDLAAGLRKIIYDYFSEVVAPRTGEGPTAPRPMPAASAVERRSALLEAIASSVAANARGFLPEVMSTSLGSVLQISFGEYLRVLPPRPVLVAFLTDTSRSETIMVELPPSFKRIAGIEEEGVETARPSVERLLNCSVSAPFGPVPFDLEVLMLETDLDYCRFTSFLEPVLQLTLQVAARAGMLTATFTLPVRAHAVGTG